MNARINQAIGGIRLATKDSKSFEIDTIGEILESAKRYVFVGFGFDPLNLTAIGIPNEGERLPNWLSKDPKLSMIFASRAGLSASAQAHAEARIPNIRWGGKEERALPFFHGLPLFS